MLQTTIMYLCARTHKYTYTLLSLVASLPPPQGKEKQSGMLCCTRWHAWDYVSQWFIHPARECSHPLLRCLSTCCIISLAVTTSLMGIMGSLDFCSFKHYAWGKISEFLV